MTTTQIMKLLEKAEKGDKSALQTLISANDSLVSRLQKLERGINRTGLYSPSLESIQNELLHLLDISSPILSSNVGKMFSLFDLAIQVSTIEKHSNDLTFTLTGSKEYEKQMFNRFTEKGVFDETWDTRKKRKFLRFLHDESVEQILGKDFYKADSDKLLQAIGEMVKRGIRSSVIKQNFAKYLSRKQTMDVAIENILGAEYDW